MADELTDAQIDVLRRYGAEREVAAGDVLFSPGDASYDLVVVLEGVVDVIGGTRDQPVVVVSQGPRRFIGEFGMLTGQRAYMTARVREPGRVLSRHDVEHVVRAPVVAEIELDPGVARTVDAGGLAGRLPRSLARALRDVA